MKRAELSSWSGISREFFQLPSFVYNPRFLTMVRGGGGGNLSLLLYTHANLSLFDNTRQASLTVKSIKSLAPLLDRVVVQRAKVVEVSPVAVDGLFCALLDNRLPLLPTQIENGFGFVLALGGQQHPPARRPRRGSRTWRTGQRWQTGTRVGTAR